MNEVYLMITVKFTSQPVGFSESLVALCEEYNTVCLLPIDGYCLNEGMVCLNDVQYPDILKERILKLILSYAPVSIHVEVNEFTEEEE